MVSYYIVSQIAQLHTCTFIIFLAVADEDLSAKALRRQMSYSKPGIMLAIG